MTALNPKEYYEKFENYPNEFSKEYIKNPQKIQQRRF